MRILRARSWRAPPVFHVGMADFAMVACHILSSTLRGNEKASFLGLTRLNPLRSRRKLTRWTLAIVLALGCVSASGETLTYQFDIPEQPAGQSLTLLAQQADVALLFSFDEVHEATTVAVVGEYTLEDALAQLLAGTNLRGGVNSHGVLTVTTRPPDTPVEGETKMASQIENKSTVKRQGLLGVLAAVFSVGANAQEPANTGEEEVIENIVVTGSRLIRRDQNAVSPIVTIPADAFHTTPQVTVEGTLNEFPQLAAANTSQVGIGGGSGVLTANLRALGPSRTLVLVNNRRFIPGSNTGFVDLTAIPSALVERVDIVTGGASAVYGSDAIAGAINFVLKDDFEGFAFDYSYGQSTHGDAGTHKVEITTGGNFHDDRGNVVVSASYTDREIIFSQDRQPTSTALFESPDGFIVGGSTAIPGSALRHSIPTLQGLQGLDWVLADGTIVTDDPCGAVIGIRFDEAANPLPLCLFEDAFDFAHGNVIRRPLERWQFTALSHYELTDQVEFFNEIFVVNNKNAFSWAPWAGNLETSGAGRNIFLVPSYATNPIVPEPVRQLFLDNPAVYDPNGDGTAEIEGSARRFEELGLRRNNYERQSYGVTVGLRGDFQVDNGSSWFWETYYMSQRARTDELAIGYVSSLRLALASDTVINPVTGETECRNQFLGCRPANVFGVGSLSAEDAEFLAPAGGDTTIVDRDMAGASLSGEVFNLPAGKVAVAFGGEWREESFEFRPSAGAAAGEFGDPTPPNAGTFDVTEFFAEVRVPILSDVPFAKLLDLELAGQLSDYSTVGSTESWRLGLQWRAVDTILFRAARSDAIRAPNLNELFLTPGFAGGQGGVDPCRADQNPTDAEKQLCVETGIPANLIDTFVQTEISFSTKVGGNVNLGEETAETWTAGLVITPAFSSNLRISFDYYDIVVDGAISSVLPDQILSSCMVTLSIQSPPCQAIHRLGSTGQLDFVDSSFTNIASLATSGLDVQINYSMGLPDALSIGSSQASLFLEGFATKVFENEVTPAPGEETIDCVGLFGGSCSGGRGINLIPEFKARLTVEYASGPLSVSLIGRYIDSFDPNPRITTIVVKVPSETYLDLFATYHATENIEIYGGIRNLTDNLPGAFGVNQFGEFGTDTATFDTVGANPFLGVRVTF